mmetsp:Transcript_129527/g.347418  ORF Transcript_129527/g.347418 Transcript_129527/m.347418 type:complete len:328 (+) Transcript_129527:321-1304(+)
MHRIVGQISTPSRSSSDAQVHLGAVVEDQHQGAADAAHDVGQEPLVEALGQALLGRDFLEAVHRPLVEVLLHGLLGLHLQAAADGVEGVRGAGADGDGGLRRDERGQGAHEALVLLVGVQADDRVEGPQLQTAVPHDAHHGHAESRVKRPEPARPLHRLHDAIAEAREGLLARAYVGGQPGPRVVQRVDDGEAPRRGHPSRDQVGGEEHRELGLGVVLREHPLERVLERQVESLRREIADAVREVSVPKAPEALLLDNALAAVDDALVARHLAAPDLRVRILRLHHKLDALDRCRDRLRHRPREAAEHEVEHEGLHGSTVLRHGSCT